MVDPTPPPPAPQRISLRSILNQLMLHLNLEKGMGYTLWTLLVRPGRVIRQYLYEDRKRLVKPLGFVFLLVGLSTYLMFSAIENELLQEMEVGIQKEINERFQLENSKQVGTQINNFVITYRNALQLSGIPLLALFSYLFFKKQKWNYAEHLVLGCYVIGYVSWFSVVGAILFFIFKQIIFLIAISALSVFYQIYFYWNVFRGSKYAFVRSILLYICYLSGFGSLLIGLVTLTIKFLL